MESQTIEELGSHICDRLTQLTLECYCHWRVIFTANFQELTIWRVIFMGNSLERMNQRDIFATYSNEPVSMGQMFTWGFRPLEIML